MTAARSGASPLFLSKCTRLSAVLAVLVAYLDEIARDAGNALSIPATQSQLCDRLNLTRAAHPRYLRSGRNFRQYNPVESSAFIEAALHGDEVGAVDLVHLPSATDGNADGPDTSMMAVAQDILPGAIGRKMPH